MNTKRLIDKLFDNWFPKTVCFVIAVLLYFFHQASLVDTKTFVLPLNIYESEKSRDTIFEQVLENYIRLKNR